MFWFYREPRLKSAEGAQGQKGATSFYRFRGRVNSSLIPTGFLIINTINDKSIQ